MDRYSSLMKRAKDGECILIDGATGTEVERRGVPQHKNSWNLGSVAVSILTTFSTASIIIFRLLTSNRAALAPIPAAFPTEII